MATKKTREQYLTERLASQYSGMKDKSLTVKIGKDGKPKVYYYGKEANNSGLTSQYYANLDTYSKEYDSLPENQKASSTSSDISKNSIISKNYFTPELTNYSAINKLSVPIPLNPDIELPEVTVTGKDGSKKSPKTATYTPPEVLKTKGLNDYNPFKEANYNLNLREWYGDNQTFKDVSGSIQPSKESGYNPLDYIEKPSINSKDIGNATSLLRFAPAVGSLVNLLDKDKAAKIDLQRVSTGRTLIPGQVNELGLQSEIDSQYNKTVGDILNTSGNSQGAARSNTLAAGLQSSKAKADAYSKINLSNIASKLQADQFNIGNENRANYTNVDVANKERLINLQNELAAQAKNEADRNAFFNSLGQIGVEQFQANVIQGANSGYGTDIFGKPTYKR